MLIRVNGVDREVSHFEDRVRCDNLWKPREEIGRD